MPRVPVAQRLVQPNAPSYTALQPADFESGGVQLARAGAGLGRAVGDAAQTMIAVEDAENEATAKGLWADFSKSARPLLDNYSSLRGVQAKDAQQGAEDQLRQLHRETLEKAPKGPVRGMLSRALDTDLQQHLSGIYRHSTQQTFEYEQNASIAMQTEAVDTAVRYGDDANQFSAYLNTATEEARKRIRRAGGDEKMADVEASKVESGAHVSRVHRLMAQERVEDAAQWLETYQNKIDPDLATTLAGQIKPILDERADDAEVNELMGITQPDRAFDREEGALPIAGAVTSGYGMRKHPIDGEMRFHKGVDLKGREGQPVPCSDEGKVIFAGTKGSYGNYVMVRHADGTDSAYAHLSAINVKEGQTIKAGTVIGAVGSTGRSTGPHLHFERYRNGQPIDPTKGVRAPRKHDMAAVINAIESGPYSFERKQRLKQAAARNISIDEQLKARAEKDAMDDVLGKIIARNGEFTSVTQLGPAFNKLGKQDQLQLINAAKANRQGGGTGFYAKDTDPALYQKLAQQAGGPPDDQKAFAATNLLAYVGRMSETDFKKMVDEQQRIKSGKGASEDAIKTREYITIAEDILGAKGVQTRPKAGEASKFERIRQYTEAMADMEMRWRRDNPGKVPGDVERRTWAGRLVLKVGDGMLFEDKAMLARVTPRARITIERDLRRDGLPVTDATVADYMRRATMQRLR